MGGPTSSDYLLMLGLLIPRTERENKYTIPSVDYCDQTNAPGHRNTVTRTRATRRITVTCEIVNSGRSIIIFAMLAEQLKLVAVCRTADWQTQPQTQTLVWILFMLDTHRYSHLTISPTHSPGKPTSHTSQ